jgi:hypothetical protein
LDEFAVIFVFNVADAPLVCAGTNHFTVDVEGFLGTYNGKGDFVLSLVSFV